jgi:copper chaperone CopZ
MKSTFACLIAVSAMAVSALAADVTAKLTDVHMCCGSCVKLAQNTVTNLAGVTAVASQEDKSIVLTGPDTMTVQKAVNELTDAGFFGKSENADIKVNAVTGAKGAKMQTLDVSNVHLCCAKCVTAVNKALTAVPGVTGLTGAAKGAKTFTVNGDFTDTDIFAALQKAGLTGKEGKPE